MDAQQRIDNARRRIESLRASINLYRKQQKEGYERLSQVYGCRSIEEAVQKAQGINDDIERYKQERDDHLAAAEAIIEEIGEI